MRKIGNDKRLRTKESQKHRDYDFQVPRSYIKNNNTITELQGLCDFYDIDYTSDWKKEDYVELLWKKGKQDKLRKLDLVWKDRRGGAGKIKLTQAWLDVAKDVVSESIYSYALSHQELYRLIVDEIELRRQKSKSGEYGKNHPKYMSQYKYKKCNIAYRTFMSYVNSENEYKGLDEKSAQLLNELQALIERKETRQKATLFEKMVADDTKGRQRFRELISTKDDRWNKTKKVDKKLDTQVAFEQMFEEIGQEQDDLTNTDNYEPETAQNDQTKTGE